MSELSEAINEMRTMRESYDELSAAAEAYNTGKTELAHNITAKGVEASASETLPELAEKVSAIAQETYEINGGEMYAKQLFGSLETPNYWNLYDILAQLLSDGRLVSYGGILLAEYYRGYDSLALSGAGAGGAYVVSDLDEQGNFKIYTNDTTHVWDSAFDGKCNRWVAYCFADEYHDFQITNTRTSPRSIFIGRKVGTISLLANSRTSRIVVADGSELNGLYSGTYTFNFGQELVIRNLNTFSNVLFYRTSSVSLPTESVYIHTKVYSGTLLYSTNFLNNLSNISTIIIYCNSFSGYITKCVAPDVKTIVVDGAQTGTISLMQYDSGYFPALTLLAITNTECSGVYEGATNGQTLPSNCIVYIGYKTNDKTKSFSFSSPNDTNRNGWKNITRLELMDGWCKPLSCHKFQGLTEANIYTYILQRLKQDEPNCGSGVTITLGSTNLAKLTSEESQALLAELRGTYGYTFA